MVGIACVMTEWEPTSLGVCTPLSSVLLRVAGGGASPGEETIARVDKLRHSSGPLSTAHVRHRMQKVSSPSVWLSILREDGRSRASGMRDTSRTLAVLKTCRVCIFFLGFCFSSVDVCVSIPTGARLHVSLFLCLSICSCHVFCQCIYPALLFCAPVLARRVA